VVAVADADLAHRLGLRPLADLVDDAADGALPVQHARRPAQDLDAFQRVGIGPGVVVGPHGVEQAVEVLGGIGAADLDGVAAIVRPERAGRNAGGIARRLLHRLGALQRHAILGDDADRLRRFHHRRVGLGGGGGALGDKALHGADRGLFDIAARHGDGGQVDLGRGGLRQDGARQAQAEYDQRQLPGPEMHRAPAGRKAYSHGNSARM
jgi:hypothetical protein